ncbi:MAG: BON domain-containing protein [Stagnimonas sp.]|nr:BON domain-containing protein [Stagnimonas sp.]
MKNQTILTRTLIAAALLASASAAQAISVGASVDVATQAVADTALTGTVKTKLAADSRVKGSDISVTSENGVVVLTGKAPSAEAKAAAEEIAKSADASVKVDNRIQAPGLLSELKTDAKVAADTTGEVVTDSWISTKIKSQLLADTATKGTAIKVTTKDNIVFLKGTVASQLEKDQAIKLASQTKGVAKVNASKLKVSTKVNADANINAQ